MRAATVRKRLLIRLFKISNRLLTRAAPGFPGLHTRSGSVLVGRAGRRNIAGDLRPALMRLGQCSGQGDAAAGDLRPGRVRRLERRGDSNSSAGAASAAAPAAAVDEATTAVSSFAPLSIVIVWPVLKPNPLATGITVAPTLMAVPTVVPPAVPTVAMTAVSRFAPVSIIIVWPAAKPATLVTLILFAPEAEAAGRVLWRPAIGNRCSCCRCRRRPGSGPHSYWSAGGGPPSSARSHRGPALGEATLQPPCPAPDAP